MKYYTIGKIVNTHGIRGDIRALISSDYPEKRLKVGEKLYITVKGEVKEEVTIQAARPQKGAYIISFEEFSNINDIEKYKNASLAIQEGQQHALDEHEYYFHEIIGLDVFTQEGDFLGKVKDIIVLGSNDVWVVQATQKGHKDILLPYIEEVVKKVDLDNGRVEIVLMEGLLNED